MCIRDRLDAIGKSRDSRYGGNDEREQTLNQLLSEMDGFDSSKGIIVLAATNRPEILDKAILRPGRFDRRIIVEKPDFKGRVDILKVHARNVHMDETCLLYTSRNLQTENKEMKSDIKHMKSDIQDLKSSVQAIQLTLDNEVIHGIRIIAEAHVDLHRKLHEALKITNEEELIAVRVTHLEKEVREINEWIDKHRPKRQHGIRQTYKLSNGVSHNEKPNKSEVPL